MGMTPPLLGEISNLKYSGQSLDILIYYLKIGKTDINHSYFSHNTVLNSTKFVYFTMEKLNFSDNIRVYLHNYFS